MTEYFQQFPNLMYSFDPANMDFYAVKNIFARVNLLDAVLNNSLIYYPYNVQDTDTIEMIAHKYYGDPKRHWMVMFSNKIIDPYFDFPLSQMNLEKNIIEKYGSLVNAQSTRHHVENQIKITNNFHGNVNVTYANTVLEDPYTYDFNTDSLQLFVPPSLDDGAFFLSNTTIILDDGTIVDTVTIQVPVSQYDYEVNTNESKRQIRLLDKQYVGALESELTSILKL